MINFMIGFNNLGRYGRLGNQMFQYAGIKGISAKHNYEWTIPHSDFKHPYYDHQLFQIFKLSSLKTIQNVPEDYPLIVESLEGFDDRLFNCCPDNINLLGYFQNEKYFKHIENEIRNDFEFKDSIFQKCNNIIEKLGKRISLHIRRNDYLLTQDELSMNYYYEALQHFDEEDKVIIFTDDIKWCNEQELFQSDRFFISPITNNYIDLCLMTLCSGHIVANSSFSWWGAWLSNSKKVVSPSKWFGGGTPPFLKDWIQI